MKNLPSVCLLGASLVVLFSSIIAMADGVHCTSTTNGSSLYVFIETGSESNGTYLSFF